jgi:melibiose permease/lactose/raffinose/galactose permease
VAATPDKRNRYFYGLGTVGRDMFYSLESMFLIYYLTEVVDLDDATMLLMTGVLTGLRIFDAVNDPLMGLVVDNTRGRFGKFKPGMVWGGVAASVLLVLMFTDLGLRGAAYVAVFAVIYLGWDVFYGVNDISYWSMLPSLTTDQKERERIGAFARICANVGLFTVVVAVLPVTGLLTDALGSDRAGWFAFAVAVSLLMLGFLSFTLAGVREPKGYFKEEDKTSLKDMVRVLGRNDQLLWVALSMALLMIGYTTTANFGTYFFKYSYGDENMYSVFALVLGLSQLVAMLVFPLASRRFSRRQLYTGAVAAIALGYVGFFFAPMSMAAIAPCGLLIFFGQAFIQVLMLMFLADSIEYGQWKMGKRNESITFSVQPFINKIAGAAANGIVGVTLVAAGINSAETVADVTAGGLTLMKAVMLLVPAGLIVAGFAVNRAKYTIDEARYAQILDDLRARGDIDRKETL